MTPFIVDIFRANDLHHVRYVEPYAGGAGAALNLLFEDAVDSIVINDANAGVYSFWHYLITESDRFIGCVQGKPITLEQWNIEHQIATQEKNPSLELGVATFFLSRTNRSGVISAGPIGGNTLEKQETAAYKLDCRFNKEDLVVRLQAIAERADRILVTQMDAMDCLRNLDPENVFVYIDPPYYVKGKSLYMNHYRHAEHQQLANYLLNEAQFKWMLSYDDVQEIRQMYGMLDLYNFPLSYTVQGVRTGMELMTHSANVVFPEKLEIRRSHSVNIQISEIN